MPEATLAHAMTSRRRAREGTNQVAKNLAWAELLDNFYSQMGLDLPSIEPVTPDSMPRVYRALLVHSNDMTPTLEKFYGDRVELTVLNREVEENRYNREVVLSLSESRKAIAYGVIRVHLNHLPPVLRKQVMEEQRPFGDILQSEALPHISWPQNFFRTALDPHMTEALHQTAPRVLYGRRNLILDGSRRLLAEVLEILAPVNAVLHLPE